jgi:hypothetical protein
MKGSIIECLRVLHIASISSVSAKLVGLNVVCNILSVAWQEVRDSNGRRSKRRREWHDSSRFCDDVDDSGTVTCYCNTSCNDQEISSSCQN